MSITLDEARVLMHEWVASESLRHHMECVSVAMAASAAAVAPNEVEQWAVCGLLHDFDYERHPTEDEHPFVGVDVLRARGDVDEAILQAILGHATYSGVSRDTDMAKYLFAVDELCGFIVAVCKVRPGGIDGLKPKSVSKKLKTANFAAAVNRDDIAQGAAELGWERTELIQHCIDALSRQSDSLMLAS